MKRCYSCFNEYGDEFEICPHCGQIEIKKPKEPIHLAPGTVLADRYILGTCVGAGGFGIVYNAWDTKLEVVVAVKEFFVSRLVTRAEGMRDLIVSKKAQVEFNYRKERFLAEARNMAKFGAHRNIPNVFEFFEENNTAYIVMELLNGMSLSDYIKQNPDGIDTSFAILIANEVSAALKSLHESGIVHRDVAPDNIYICSDKEIKIKLMDLGAAKLADTTDDVVDIILKPGYSPAEQYDKSKNIGPWTDIYALGATLYVLLTGIKPDESTNRKIKDEVVYPYEINPGISVNLSNTVMKAMAVEKHMRFKNIDEFLKALNGQAKVISVEKEKKRRKARRYYGIAAACFALIAVFSVIFGMFSQKKAQETLEPAKIELWHYSYDETKIKMITDSFREIYPDVVIETRCIPDKQTYETELLNSIEQGTLPDLFESSDIDSNIIASATDISSVLESEAAKDCLFLEQYSNYYSEFKQIPLAIEVPVLYVDKRTGLNIERFDSLGDLGLKIAADQRAESLIMRNFDYQYDGGASDFPTSCQALLSTTSYANEFKLATDLENAEVLSVCAIYPSNSELYCKFICEWSIGIGDENQIKAAKMLLSWMLGENYQSMLIVGRGCLPVCEITFRETAHGLYENIIYVYNNFVFKR